MNDSDAGSPPTSEASLAASVLSRSDTSTSPLVFHALTTGAPSRSSPCATLSNIVTVDAYAATSPKLAPL